MPLRSSTYLTYMVTLSPGLSTSLASSTKSVSEKSWRPQRPHALSKARRLDTAKRRSLTRILTKASLLAPKSTKHPWGFTVMTVPLNASPITRSFSS
jgi:hypothetical protein